jgi:FG-GAP-like repeat/Abnormal spindle-like microcephaly-assoc'd, ASPM-SPD-2-Hydin
VANLRLRSGGLPASFSLVVFMMLALVSLNVMGQTMVFNGPRNYPVGASGLTPNTVAIADFNGDGFPDIAVANNSSNDVSVLLQNPNGTFQTAVSYAVGHQPMSIQVGDVNGDGKADLILVNNADNTIGILLGNGDGTFQPQQTTVLPVSAQYNLYPLLVAGDWNADGKTDVAVAGSLPIAGQYALSVLLSNGDGTFQPPINYSPAELPEALNASDFNGDGKLDLVTVDFNNNLSVWLGIGNGTFQSAIVTPSSQYFWPGSLLVVSDFNQDGHPDIAASTGTPYSNGFPGFTLFLGNGDGTFQVIIESTEIPLYSPFATGDVNGDGKPDLLVLSSYSDSPAAILLNSGNAVFTAAPMSLPLQWTVGLGGTYYDAVGATLYDLNGDQKLDLVSVDLGPNIVSVLYGNGNGAFAQFPIYGISNGSLGALVTADFNNDGKPDVATAFRDIDTEQLSIGVLMNTGAGFSSQSYTVTGLIYDTTKSSYIVTGDFNHDGNVDTAVSSAPPSYGDVGIFVLLGNGNGTFQTAVEYDQVIGPLAVADFNHDGNLDIVGSSTNGSGFSVLSGNGDGTFGFPITTALPCCEAIDAVVVADFNQDGKTDLSAIIDDGTNRQVVIFFGNSDGTFTAGASYNAGAFPICMAAADLNGDGKIDVIIGNQSQVVALLGNGDGTFQAPIITNTDHNGTFSISVADFNLDGKLDVAIGESGGIALLQGNGDGTLQAPIMFFVAAPFGLAQADFDGNGAPDLAVGGTPGGTSLLLNATGSNPPAALVSSASLNFGGVLVGQSGSMTTTLTYNASTVLSITGVTLTGAQAADFSETNTCGATLAAGMSCMITVTFAPLATGARVASIQIADNAFNTPQVISLIGTGSAHTVSTSSLTFGSQAVGSTSAPQTLSFTNTGTLPVTINSISVTGPQAGDFGVGIGCSVPDYLAGGADCIMTITFTPAALGARSATLNISDSDSSTPQTVALSGTGAASSVGLATGSNSTTAAVQAGQTATYALLIGGAGMSGSATIACSGAPTGATCTVPGSVTVNATIISTVTISVSTTARSAAAIDHRTIRFTGLWATLLLGVACVPMALKKRSAAPLCLCLMLGSLLLISACGGTTTTSTTGGSSGTPAGTYNLAVTATLNSSKESVNLQLIVR